MLRNSIKREERRDFFTYRSKFYGFVAHVFPLIVFGGANPELKEQTMSCFMIALSTVSPSIYIIYG